MSFNCGLNVNGIRIFFLLFHLSSTSKHDVGVKEVPTPQTVVPLSLEDLDRTIASFDTVEQLLKSLSPSTWREDLDSIYTQTYVHYRSRSYYLAGRHDKGKRINTRKILFFLDMAEERFFYEEFLC